MTDKINLNEIDNAIMHLKEQAGMVMSLSSHWSQREKAESAVKAACAAEKEMQKLHRQLSKLLELQRQSDRSYDAYVTSPEECTCHINPPCNFCIGKPEQ
jgi:hypothetical protein